MFQAPVQIISDIVPRICWEVFLNQDTGIDVGVLARDVEVKIESYLRVGVSVRETDDACRWVDVCEGV